MPEINEIRKFSDFIKDKLQKVILFACKFSNFFKFVYAFELISH